MFSFFRQRRQTGVRNSNSLSNLSTREIERDSGKNRPSRKKYRLTPIGPEAQFDFKCPTNNRDTFSRSLRSGPFEDFDGAVERILYD